MKESIKIKEKKSRNGEGRKEGRGGEESDIRWKGRKCWESGRENRNGR